MDLHEVPVDGLIHSSAKGQVWQYWKLPVPLLASFRTPVGITHAHPRRALSDALQLVGPDAHLAS